MEDVLEVYARPYDEKRPVVCLDEARKELRSTPRGTVAAEPGQPARQDYEYERHGTASFFLWLEPLGGRRHLHVTERQTGHELAEVLRYLAEEAYPHAEKIVLVTDNLKTHKPDCLYNRFPPEQAFAIMHKIEWHYTPEHGSWLNMAECELAVLSRECLDRRITDRDALTEEISCWEKRRNERHKTVDWQFTTTHARTKLKRLYPVFKEQ